MHCSYNYHKLFKTVTKLIEFNNTSLNSIIYDNVLLI